MSQDPTHFWISSNPPLSPHGVGQVIADTDAAFGKDIIDMFYEPEIPAFQVVADQERQDKIMVHVTELINTLLDMETDLSDYDSDSDLDSADGLLHGVRSFNGLESVPKQPKTISWAKYDSHQSQLFREYEPYRYPQVLKPYRNKAVWHGLACRDGWTLTFLMDRIWDVWQGHGMPANIEGFEKLFACSIEWNHCQTILYFGTNATSGRESLLKVVAALQNAFDVIVKLCSDPKSPQDSALNLTSHLVMTPNPDSASVIARYFANVGFAKTTYLTSVSAQNPLEHDDLKTAVTLRTLQYDIDRQWSADSTRYPPTDRPPPDIKDTFAIFHDYEPRLGEVGCQVTWFDGRADRLRQKNILVPDLAESPAQMDGRKPATPPSLLDLAIDELPSSRTGYESITPLQSQYGKHDELLIDISDAAEPGSLELDIDVLTEGVNRLRITDRPPKKQRPDIKDTFGTKHADVVECLMLMSDTKPVSKDHRQALPRISSPILVEQTHKDNERNPYPGKSGFISVLKSEFGHIIDILRVTSGPVALSMSFGRICMSEYEPASIWDGVSGSRMSVQQARQHLQLRYPALKGDIAFTPILSTCAADATALAQIRPSHKAAWILPSAESRTIKYDFHCHLTNEGQRRFTVTIDASNLRAEVCGPRHELATVLIHCPRLAWDLKVAATYVPDAAEMMDAKPAAQNLVKSLKVTTKSPRGIELEFVQDEKHDLVVDEVHMRQVAEYENQACRDSILLVTVTQQMVMRRSDRQQEQTKGNIRVSARSRPVCHKSTRPSQWVEASIQSRRGRDILEANLELQLGDKAEWDHEQLESDGVLEAICLPAMAMVGEMDYIGLHNDNCQAQQAQQRPEQRTHLPRTGGRGVTRAQVEEVFW